MYRERDGDQGTLELMKSTRHRWTVPPVCRYCQFHTCHHGKADGAIADKVRQNMIEFLR